MSVLASARPWAYLSFDVLLWSGDEAGTAEPQHDHDGQEEAGC